MSAKPLVRLFLLSLLPTGLHAQQSRSESSLTETFIGDDHSQVLR
jgi:hypothetical protein